MKMNKLIILLMLMTLPFIGWSQQSELEDDVQNDAIHLNSKNRAASAIEPIIFIGETKISRSEMEDIDSNDIAEIHVYKGEKAIEKYGKEGENGVIAITLKKKKVKKYKQLLEEK